MNEIPALCYNVALVILCVGYFINSRELENLRNKSADPEISRLRNLCFSHSKTIALLEDRINKFTVKPPEIDNKRRKR